jgi:hypothetical protein
MPGEKSPGLCFGAPASRRAQACPERLVPSAAREAREGAIDEAALKAASILSGGSRGLVAPRAEPEGAGGGSPDASTIRLSRLERFLVPVN